MATPTKITDCFPITMVLRDIATKEEKTCKFDLIFRNGSAFLEPRQGEVTIAGPPGSVSAHVKPEEGNQIVATPPSGQEVVSVTSDAPQEVATIETQDGSAQQNSDGQSVEGEASEGAGVKEDGTQGDGSQKETEICVVNPSNTEIPGSTRVLVAQDNEENWVVIWAECN